VWIPAFTPCSSKSRFEVGLTIRGHFRPTCIPPAMLSSHFVRPCPRRRSDHSSFGQHPPTTRNSKYRARLRIAQDVMPPPPPPSQRDDPTSVAAHSGRITCSCERITAARSASVIRNCVTTIANSVCARAPSVLLEVQRKQCCNRRQHVAGCRRGSHSSIADVRAAFDFQAKGPRRGPLRASTAQA